MTWRPLPAEGGHEPRRLGEAIDGVVRSAGGPGAGALTAVFAGWEELAGPVAAHCRPVALAGRTLVVAVDQPGRATEVRYRSGELVRRIAEVAGVGVVERLEVQVRPPHVGRGHPPVLN